MTRTSTLGLCLLLALAAFPACKKPTAEPHKDGVAEDGKEPFGKLTIDELETRMTAAKAGQGKLAIFDNNQRERFDKGHIPGAKWVKFDDVQAKDLPSDKQATLVFYCANEH